MSKHRPSPFVRGAIPDKIREDTLPVLARHLRDALDDEAQAAPFYLKLAELVQKLGLEGAQGTLRGIASDEQRHHSLIANLLMRVNDAQRAGGR